MTRDVMADPATARQVERLVNAPQAASQRPAPAGLAQALSHVSLPGSFRHHLLGRLAQPASAAPEKPAMAWVPPTLPWAQN
jgi:hypothetical protein